MKMSAEDGCVEAELYMGMACTLGCMFEPDVIGISMIPYHKAEYRDIATPLLTGYVPDFDEEELCKAILTYQQRERRFGKTSEQIAEENNNI